MWRDDVAVALQVVACFGHVDGDQGADGGLVPPGVPEPADSSWWPGAEVAWAQFRDDAGRDRHADRRERIGRAGGGGVGGNLDVWRVGGDEPVWTR